MSFSIDKIFTTATDLSGLKSAITEVEPCDALKPYIRCFWETDCGNGDALLRVIPDCCADILIYLSDGEVQSNFCGVCNRSFIAHGTVKTFGIRFYAWSVRLFSSADMNGTLNGFLPADAVFNNFGAVASEINRAKTMRGRIAVAQRHLLETLCRDRENGDVMNGIYKIITWRAKVNVSGLSDYCATGKRALERNFRAFTGLSPKEAIDLIRYQLLWQSCLRAGFNVLDCVEKFGFYDAAHLYNDFKKYHGIPLPQALKII